MPAPRSAICTGPIRSTPKSRLTAPSFRISTSPAGGGCATASSSKRDAVIQYGIANGRFPQRKLLMEEQRPDMISTCFNAHDECFDYEPGNEPVELYAIHDRDELQRILRADQPLGVKIEVEAFHYGGVWNAMRMMEKGLLKGPVWVTFFLGWKGGCWTPPTVQAMTYMADHCPENFVWNTSRDGPGRAVEGAVDGDHASAAMSASAWRTIPSSRPANMRAAMPIWSKRSCASRGISGATSPRRTRPAAFSASAGERRPKGARPLPQECCSKQRNGEQDGHSKAEFSFSQTTVNRRSVLAAGAVGAAALGGLLAPRRAAAATKLNFQTSAGARFGTPNAVLIKDFNQENPDLQVAMDTVPVQNYFPKLSTQVASNDPSLECFTGITNLLYAFAATGKIVPFDEVWTPEQIADIEKDVPKRYLDTWRFKGKLYAIPNDFNAQWSFYRKDLFDKAGVKVPAKWEDAAAIAKQLTKDGVYGYTASLRRGEYAGAHFTAFCIRMAASIGTKASIRPSTARPARRPSRSCWS